MEDFRDYLEAVCQAPRLRGTCGTYVETEVADRLRLSPPEEEFDFHPLAEQELVDAAAYYEEQKIGLGLEYLREVESAVNFLIRYSDFGSGTP
jgi:hypothetical protein